MSLPYLFLFNLMHWRFRAAFSALEGVLERLERPLAHAQGRPALQVVLDQLAPVVRQQALGPHRVQLRLGHLGINKGGLRSPGSLLRIDVASEVIWRSLRQGSLLRLDMSSDLRSLGCH